MIKQLVLHFLLSLFVVHLVHANNATWVTTAPVVSVNTCTWTPASICTTEFSSLNGVYNSSWTGTISFSDLTPPGGNLLSLKVQLYGAFESGISGVNIPVLINNNNWATWIYLPTYSNDCTTRTDTVTIPGPAAALTQSSNSLTFVIPNNGPQISACGAVISGTYQVASPSKTASISKTPTISVSSSRPQTQSPVTSPSVSSSSTPAATPPGPGSWTSTAPVATQGTCDWTPTSICSTDFFSASGLLGSTNISNSWSGDLYFADLTPNELTLDSLTVQLCGSFEPVTAASISVAINNVPWLTWNSFDSYDFNCTSNTDCVTLTGQPVGPALSQENNNILHFEIASGTPQIFGCGATITGNYSFQGISQSPSNSRTPTQSTTSSTTPSLTQSVGFTQSPSPTQSVGFTHSSSPTQSGISQSPTRSQTLTWTTTAPVETMGTCFWNPGSMCISDFFSANGKYGVNWSGGVYFNDLAAPGTFTTSLSVQIYGSFATVQSNFSIPIYINGQNWTMWEYTNVTYTSNCVDGTDTAIVSANLGGVDLIPTGNFLNISIPDGGPSISACGAVITGVTMVGNASPSVTSSVSASFIPPSNSTSPSLSSSPSITPSQSASEQISWWAVALIIGTVVVILVASIIGTGAAFYHKKSKQLNQYAIMS